MQLNMPSSSNSGDPIVGEGSTPEEAIADAIAKGAEPGTFQITPGEEGFADNIVEIDAVEMERYTHRIISAIGTREEIEEALDYLITLIEADQIFPEQVRITISAGLLQGQHDHEQTITDPVLLKRIHDAGFPVLLAEQRYAPFDLLCELALSSYDRGFVAAQARKTLKQGPPSGTEQERDMWLLAADLSSQPKMTIEDLNSTLALFA